MDNKFMLIYFLITAQIKSGLGTQKNIQKGTNRFWLVPFYAIFKEVRMPSRPSALLGTVVLGILRNAGF